jgi:hypothetical protein
MSRVRPLNVTLEAQDHTGRFRDCAGTHGLRLHRIHVPTGARGGCQCTVVFDCSCGQRWLLRVSQGEVASVDGQILGELKRGREGQATSPPGFPGLLSEG